MHVNKLILSLKSFGECLPLLVANVSDQDARWKPSSQNWSILEIICHLVDEEVHDFRQRVRITLEDPSQKWPPVDPENWAVDKKYNHQDLVAKVQQFTTERAHSIDWLENLSNPDWNRTYKHEHLGLFRAGDLLAAWTAHDQLHVRQIAKRKYEMIRRDADGYSTHYAGQWTE